MKKLTTIETAFYKELFKAFSDDRMDGDWTKSEYSESGKDSFDYSSVFNDTKYDSLDEDQKDEVFQEVYQKF